MLHSNIVEKDINISELAYGFFDQPLGFNRLSKVSCYVLNLIVLGSELLDDFIDFSFWSEPVDNDVTADPGEGACHAEPNA